MGEYIHFIGIKKNADDQWERVKNTTEKLTSVYHDVFKGSSYADPILPIKDWPSDCNQRFCDDDYGHTHFDLPDLFDFDFDTKMSHNGNKCEMSWREYITSTLGYDNVEEFLEWPFAEFKDAGATRMLIFFDN